MLYGTTLQQSIEAARARQQAAQCQTGRHVAGCPHRPATSPWVALATASRLPAKELSR